MRFVLIILFFCFVFAGSCAKGVKVDTSMAAILANDYTALIQGCGNPLVNGYTYCRKTEGSAANESLIFVAPPSQCTTDSCVSFKIFNQDGELVYGASIPKGQTKSTIAWKDLLKRDTFEKNDRGFWQYTYDIKYLDPNGKEYLSRSIGEIRMRVLPKDYVPLDQVKDDPNFVWVWVQDGTQVKMTTGARTYVEKK